MPVKKDPSQINHILHNLTLNTKDAIPDVGRIKIAIADRPIRKTDAPTDLPPGHYVLLTFSDSGNGMNRNFLEKIFEPYFTTKNVGEGAGLGLSVGHGIIKQNGGAICLDSKPGGGTRFIVYFPGYQSEPENGKAALRRPPWHKRKGCS